MFSGDTLEAELFGHEKGAFSGADRLKPGKLETAHQGTLLIEEIGDMTLRVQGRLLQVVDHGVFTRGGGHRSLTTDLRLIVSASIDLEAAVRAKRFREDLYSRLSAVEIVVPALRQRRQEIPALVAHFVDRFNAQYGRATAIAPETLALFDEHGWPGNVDELEDAVRRLVIGGSSATVQRQLFDAMGAEPLPSRRRFHQPPVVAARSDDGESVRARRRLA
jgi:DNA-binding NtrC family response regulator